MVRLARNLGTGLQTLAYREDYHGDGCATREYAIDAWAAPITLYAQWCNVNNDCTTYATLSIVNNIFQAYANGPQTRRTGVSGTWTAGVIAGNSVAPYTYLWEGAISSTDQTVTAEIPYPGDDISLTVTDANGRTSTVVFHVYVCDDIC
jgi:hypothetical protein